MNDQSPTTTLEQPSDTDRYFREMAEEISAEWTGPHKGAVRVALTIMADRIIKEIGG